MRILANYGCRNNGDNYSVTFETMGDVPREHVEETVDELFRLAKAAVQRQIEENSATTVSFPENNGITVPKPTCPERSRREQNGNGKPQLKDPDAPATKKQKSLIARLAKERGRFIEGLNSLTMAEASATIDELMACPV